MSISTANDQLVGIQGDDVIVMRPKQRMTQDEALRHAAWLVAISEKSFDEFKQVYEAVLDC